LIELWLRCLDADFSSQRAEFNPRELLVDFMANEVAMWEVKK
jgi:hypothetical protein